LSVLFKAPKASVSILSIPMLLGLLTVSTIVINIIYQIFSLIGLEPKIPDFTPPTQQSAFIIYSLLMTVCAAFFEEFFCRGLIMHSLRKYGDSVALVVSSVVFALMHQNLVQGLNAFVLGLFIGYFVLRTGSLWTGIILHFTNNALSVVLTLISTNFPQEQAIIISLGLNFLFILFGILAFVVFKVWDKNAFKLINRESTLGVSMKIRICFSSVGMLVTIAYLLFKVITSFQIL
ncbi:MAG: putative metal-dependent rane protease, partial [Oscillospiraceae bacterium]|nr:putative metal-dependent rane protease [Oscillospiraceae bacterium]